jgi:hypothetical protein
MAARTAKGATTNAGELAGRAERPLAIRRCRRCTGTSPWMVSGAAKGAGQKGGAGAGAIWWGKRWGGVGNGECRNGFGMMRFGEES